MHGLEAPSPSKIMVGGYEEWEVKLESFLVDCFDFDSDDFKGDSVQYLVESYSLELKETVAFSC